MDSIFALGEIGALEGGGVSRLAFSKEDKQGRDLVLGWMKELNLDIRVDGIGNVIGVCAGKKNSPPVMIGSHIDTVRTGGLYDGNLGVLAGIEVIRTLRENNIKTNSPIAVAFFSNEEGARFAPDMMGSLVFRGNLPLNKALNTIGIDGKRVGECLKDIGYNGKAEVGDNCFALKAYLELHVEQGPILDKEDITIGAVEKVQGISWTKITVTGVSNHAGTTPLAMRNDAGLVAGEAIAFVRKLSKEMGGNQIATVGSLQLTPDLINVVANKAEFTLDLRNTEEKLLKQAEQKVFQFILDITKQEGCTVNFKTLARFKPVDFNNDLINLVEQTAKENGYSVKRMCSGAGHDAQIMAEICPSSMIFVKSQNGISHNINEHTEIKDIEAGANVLLQSILQIANE